MPILSFRLASFAAVIGLTACHPHASPITTAAAADNARRCAELVPPSPGDTAYKHVLPPLVRSPVSLSGSQFAEYGLMARVHVDKAGNVDSIMIQDGGRYNQALRSRLANARARPARYQGCPIAAWTTVDAS